MTKLTRLILPSIAVALACGSAWAQPKGERLDFGKREFDSSCASCHSRDGKGAGPVAPYLTKSPPDLTTEAKRNSGVFPMDRLFKVIDGASIGAHGTKDMPVWGRYYRLEAAEYYVDMNYDEPAYVRARILALLEYINRLQVK